MHHAVQEREGHYCFDDELTPCRLSSRLLLGYPSMIRNLQDGHHCFSSFLLDRDSRGDQLFVCRNRNVR